MKRETFSHPADRIVGRFASVVIYKTRLEAAVVGVVNDGERHLVERIVIQSSAIWTDGIRQLVEALADSSIDRVGLYYTQRYEDSLAAVEALKVIAPAGLFSAARENLPDGASRPLLFSKFDRVLAKVGMVEASRIAEKTILNTTVPENHLAVVAIAVEEYHRRIRKAKRKEEKPAPVAVPHVADLAAEVEALKALVASQTALIEKLVAQGAAR